MTTVEKLCVKIKNILDEYSRKPPYYPSIIQSLSLLEKIDVHNYCSCQIVYFKVRLGRSHIS
jgi:hypothetical protein